jgi:NAD(P)H dehydrogenase (quinone)
VGLNFFLTHSTGEHGPFRQGEQLTSWSVLVEARHSIQNQRMKKICIINAHPKAGSLSDAIVESYSKGARSAEAEIDAIVLRDLKFNPARIPEGASNMEADLVDAQKRISACQHLAIVFPTWWTSVPVLLKGFLDLSFNSGWAFVYQKNGFPKGLLKGRSARILHTCGAPAFANKWIYSEPEVKMMKKGVLQFCGFSPVKVSKFGSIMGDKSGEGSAAIQQAFKDGVSDARS